MCVYVYVYKYVYVYVYVYVVYVYVYVYVYVCVCVCVCVMYVYGMGMHKYTHAHTDIHTHYPDYVIPQIAKRVSTFEALVVSFPRLLLAFGDSHCPVIIHPRVVIGQVVKLKEQFHKLPRDIIEAAQNIYLESGNSYKYTCADGGVVYFVNSSRCLVQGDPCNKVTKARCNHWFSYKPKMSFEESRSRYLSLYQVALYPVGNDSAAMCTRLSCTCASYLENGFRCSHILAVMKIIGILDIPRLLADLNPVRGTYNTRY